MKRFLALGGALLALSATPSYAGPAGYTVNGTCSFSMLQDTNAPTTSVVVTGRAWATAGLGDVPASTTITCTVSMSGSSGTSTRTTPGAVSATHDRFTGWTAGELTLCSSASATFFPSGFTLIQPETCSPF